MEIKRLKERSRARMAKYAEENTESSEDSDILEVNNHSFTVEDKKAITMKYKELQQNNLSPDNNDYSSLLLPSFLPTCTRTDVTVNVKGVNDVVLKAATEVSADKYIKSVVEERNRAVRSMLTYRDMVEDLQSKNRVLHCTMNDRIDTVKKFWRNSILEGGSRGGVCVRKALDKKCCKTIAP